LTLFSKRDRIHARRCFAADAKKAADRQKERALAAVQAITAAKTKHTRRRQEKPAAKETKTTVTKIKPVVAEIKRQHKRR